MHNKRRPSSLPGIALEAADKPLAKLNLNMGSLQCSHSWLRCAQFFH